MHNNKFVKLSKNSFFRKINNYGYILNQLTKHDRIYDSIGAIFLEKITRTGMNVSSIIDDLSLLFLNVNRENLYNDFIDFVKDLGVDGFIITGDSDEELDLKDREFSYKDITPKTIANDFSQKNKESILKDSQVFFYENFRDNPKLMSMQIELTEKCNERCIHCYLPNEHKSKSIFAETSMLFRILDEAKEMGCIGVTLSGGEPLLHKNIKDILKKCRENDFSISILSNLTLLDDELIKIIKEVNINAVQVSLYSMEETEHDYITNLKGSFILTKNNILKLIENDIPLQISCPVMKVNRKSYKEVLEWAYSHKIRAYTDFIMMAQTDFSTKNLKNRININETEELLKDILDYDEDYKDMINTKEKCSLKEYSELPVCGVGLDNLCLAADGNFYPCPGWQGWILGNAYKSSLEEIWRNSDKLKYLRKITNNSFKECIPCESKDYCAMCMVRNFNESGGDIFKINKHFCDVAYLTKKLVEEKLAQNQVNNTNNKYIK